MTDTTDYYLSFLPQIVTSRIRSTVHIYDLRGADGGYLNKCMWGKICYIHYSSDFLKVHFIIKKIMFLFFLYEVAISYSVSLKQLIFCDNILYVTYLFIYFITSFIYLKFFFTVIIFTGNVLLGSV